MQTNYDSELIWVRKKSARSLRSF